MIFQLQPITQASYPPVASTISAKSADKAEQ
jgi:hypothetical protein